MQGHILALFLTFARQLAFEYELREKKRMEDAARLACAKRAKERVIIYAWGLPDDPPLVHAVQGSFSWPYLDLSMQLLTCVRLDHGEDMPSKCMTTKGWRCGWMLMLITLLQ